MITLCCRSRQGQSPLLRALLIGAGVLLLLAAVGGLCAKCKEHMACCAGEGDECCADDDTEDEPEEGEKGEEH